MSKRVQDEKPPQTEEVKAWLKEEIGAQDVRYKAIIDEMEALNEKRDGWYADFLAIIQSKGVNVTGDMRRIVPKEEIPEKPDRPDADRVIW